MTPQETPGLTTSGLGGAGWGDGGPNSFEALKNDPAAWTITILAPTDWISMNHRTHWAEKARRTKAWRLAGQVYARNQGLPKGLGHVHITATVTKPTRRAFDVHNLLPSFKAAIDGLVDYGLIPDDSTKYLTGPDMRVNPENGQAAVTLTITQMKDTK